MLVAEGVGVSPAFVGDVTLPYEASVHSAFAGNVALPYEVRVHSAFVGDVTLPCGASVKLGAGVTRLPWLRLL